MKKPDLFFAFILLPVDIIMIIAAFVLAYYVRIDLEVVPAFYDIGLREYLRYSIYLMPFWIALLALNGLYYTKASAGFINEVYRIFSASSTAMLILIVEIFLTKSSFFSRLILVFTWLFAIVTISVGRFVIKMIRRYFFRYGVGRINVLLIGDNITSENVVYYLAKNENFVYKSVGVLNNGSQTSKYGLKIIGSVDELDKKIQALNVDEIILTDIDISKQKIINIIQICSDRNIAFKYIPDTFSLMTLNVSPSLIGTMPVMELRSAPIDGWGRIVKRIVDLIFSSILLVLLSPAFLVVAMMVKFTSEGSVFYAQKRIGRDEKMFYFHKFRSMVDGANKKQAWTTQDKSELLITPFGKLLRKTNIDELPQLWDIFIGNMSFVGPRPEQPKFVEKFEQEIPDYFRRHKVKSGLTGWAQVNGLKGDTSIRERVRYDMYYIENWSLWFDCKIVFKTLWLLIYEVFKGKYEYRPSSRLDN